MDEIIKAPLWQKVTAVVIIVLAVIWGYNKYLLSPKFKEINSLVQTLKSIDQEIELIIPREEVIKGGVNVSELVKKELEDLMKKIPTEQEVPFIIDELISQVGVGLNISYDLIKPEPIVAEDRYKRLPLRISFTSDYTDLNLYLKQLKNLPTTVRIDSLALDRTDTQGRLRVSMALSAFVMPGGAPPKEVKTGTEKKPYLFDPFFMPGGEKSKIPGEKKAAIELQGIWIGRQVRAVINDKEVGIGESVDGYKVLDIGINQVTLLKDKTKIVLEMGGKK